MRASHRVAWTVGSIGVGILGGAIVALEPSLALALAIAPLLLVCVWLFTRTRFFVTPGPMRWIPIAWCVLFFISNVKTDRFRDAAAAASGSLGADNKIELAAYGLVAAAVVATWFHLRPRRPAVALWPLWLWPSFALLSTMWSPIPLFTFARASQLLIVVALALLCIGLDRDHPGWGRAIVVDALRLFVILTAALSLWGLLDRSLWTGGRYVWPTGQHPIIVGLFAGVALLIVLLGGRSVLRLPLWLRASLIALLSSVLILGQNRSVFLATAIGILVSLWATRGKNEIWVRYLVMPALVCAVLVFVVFAGNILLVYFTRGQSGRALVTLTGRTDLWTTALGQLDTPAEWISGFGYGAPRVILERLVDWAGQAHNSLIEVLLGVGLVGATAVVASFVAVGHRVMSGRAADAQPRAAVEAGLLAQLLTMGIFEALLVIPSLGYSMLCFLYLAACVGDGPRHRRGMVTTEEGSRRDRRASPVLA